MLVHQFAVRDHRPVHGAHWQTMEEAQQREREEGQGVTEKTTLSSTKNVWEKRMEEDDTLKVTRDGVRAAPKSTPEDKHHCVDEVKVVGHQIEEKNASMSISFIGSCPVCRQPHTRTASLTSGPGRHERFRNCSPGQHLCAHLMPMPRFTTAVNPFKYS
ncbi:uncharacterized protein [Panulirus ornatus]|uniref:uncharacterized protein n=1 Tax=Panulirus ornatus TaxID=150431 RepID=UPI003A891FC8